MSEARLGPDQWGPALGDTDGRQIVVAGPGAGKTEFLLRRVRDLIQGTSATPAEIMVLSFSRRSAARLQRRLVDLLGDTGLTLQVTTFHSLATRILEAAAGSPVVTLTTPEQVAVVQDLLHREEPFSWPTLFRQALTSHAFASELADFMLRCSERLLDPGALSAAAADRPEWTALPDFYGRYLTRLQETDKTDYGTLLTSAIEALAADSGIVGAISHVIVDEYQDTTVAQAELANLIATPTGNITVAGDPYQSIYSFRGADLTNIAEFSSAPGTKRWVLTDSFRVPEPIIEAALRVVSGGDLPGAAGPVQPAGHHGVATAHVFDQESAEAEWIASEVERMIRIERTPPREIAVVVRSKREFLNEMSRALGRRQIPHDEPRARLVDHPAIRVVDDLVTIADSQAESDELASPLIGSAMRRVLLGPFYRLTLSRFRELERARLRTGKSWFDVIVEHEPDFTGLLSLISEPGWARDVAAADGFWHWWKHIDGVEAVVADPDFGEWRSAWSAFAQATRRQAERDQSVSLRQYFRLVAEDDFEATPLLSFQERGERVSLTTLHQIKGLSFDSVFIANAVEGVFPDVTRSKRLLRPELLAPSASDDPSDHHLFSLQEEMRLAYTAITRARRRVVMTATDAGVDQGDKRPSRFLYAMAGDSQPSQPDEDQREPASIREAESLLRRSLLDPEVPTARRVAALELLANPPRPWWDPDQFAGIRPPGPDSPVIGASLTLSPSQGESYSQCPRRYVMERRLRIGGSDSVYSKFGVLIHTILELAEGEIIGEGVLHAPLERALEILDEQWAEADFGTPGLTEAWRQKGVELITHLYDHWPGKGHPVALEVDVELDVEGTRWVGKIDRLESGSDGRFRIVDYKTGTSAPSQDEAAESLQLGFYALAVAASRGEVSTAEMWFPRVNKKSVARRGVATHEIESISDRLTAITRAIRSEDWEPESGEHCKNCAFIRSCPAWPEGRGAYLP